MIPKCYYCCLYALCPLSGLQPPQPVVWWDEGRIRGLACLQGDFFRRIGRESEVTEFGLWAVGFKLPNHADYFVFILGTGLEEPGHFLGLLFMFVSTLLSEWEKRKATTLTKHAEVINQC